MVNSQLYTDALELTLELLTQGEKNVLDSVRKEFSTSEKQLSKKQWDDYYENVLTEVLENIADENAVKDFMSEFSLLDNTLLGSALDDDDISLENVSLVIEKMKEDCLRKACCHNYDDLIDFFLSKDKSMANFRFMDGSYVLQFAAQFGSKDVIDCLIRYGAIPYCEDSKGQNILHYAAKNPSNEVWNYLTSDPRFSILSVRKNKAGQYPIELVDRI